MAENPHKDPQTPDGTTAEVVVAGTIERFTFRNEDTGFAVVRLVPEGRTAPIHAVGQLAQLVEGQQVKIHGKEVEHPRFGPQLQVDSVEASVPGTAEGIVAYLSSSLVKGIGPSTAERIVARFGTETLRIIEEEPERLGEISGLGAKRIRDLTQAVAAQRGVQDVMVFLRSHGLGQALAARIVKHLGNDASARIQANPYRLVDEVIGVGFQTADRLAQNLGLAEDAPERLRAGLVHALSVAASRDGHCFVPELELARRAASLLRCGDDLVAAQLEELCNTTKVVRDPSIDVPERTDDGEGARAGEAGAAIYPSVLFLAERGAAALLAKLTATGPALRLDAEAAVDWYRSRSGMQLPEGQHRAVVHAIRHPVSVITGGPGVGKTTIIRALAQILTAKGLVLRLAAPTGRAAKRLEESTEHGASTIHRLLEFQPGIQRFVRDHENALTGDMLVVDEASMLDTHLAYSLFCAVPPGMHLVLVGDVDQLPAVGAGNVLHDVIASTRVPVTRLTEIFRQHRDSRIVRAAHSVRDGELPESPAPGTEPASDFFFVETKSSAHTRAVVRELVKERIPNAFGLDAIADVQVLCPMYRGEAGADRLNSDLQDALNPGDEAIQRGGHRFRLGDKVMQVRNDYDLDVFNGDTGRIVHLGTANGTLTVDYGDRPVVYSLGDLDDLVPAYAITVHRSQGSEYPAVVMPLATDHFMMLRRNLLYTAITRGKKLVVLAGARRALELAVGNHEEGTRYSGLAQRLATAR